MAKTKKKHGRLNTPGNGWCTCWKFCYSAWIVEKSFIHPWSSRSHSFHIHILWTQKIVTKTKLWSHARFARWTHLLKSGPTSSKARMDRRTTAAACRGFRETTPMWRWMFEQRWWAEWSSCECANPPRTVNHALSLSFLIRFSTKNCHVCSVPFLIRASWSSSSQSWLGHRSPDFRASFK